jgi:hypothetical protein
MIISILTQPCLYQTYPKSSCYLINFIENNLNQWYYLLLRRFLSFDNAIASLEFHHHSSSHFVFYSERFIWWKRYLFSIVGITKMTPKNLWCSLNTVNAEVTCAPKARFTNYKIDFIDRMNKFIILSVYSIWRVLLFEANHIQY